MMEEGTRIEREFTYKTGWKRSVIIISPKSPSTPLDPNRFSKGEEPAEWYSVFHRVNMAGLWRSAGSPNHHIVLMGLLLFPLLVFILSLWLVHAIVIQPT